jgi:hypothetical protein
MGEEEVLRQELRALTDQVDYLLGKYPETRNNDFFLALLWLKYFSGIDAFKNIWVEEKDVNQVQSKLETVTRIRRKFQHTGYYLPTRPDVIEKRKLKEEAMRRVMAREDW